MPADPLISVKKLKVYFKIHSNSLFKTKHGFVRAVDEISFTLKRGETLGLVGESGSGKTTVGRAIVRAVNITEGSITYHLDDRDVNLVQCHGRDLQKFRKRMQLIFQDPYSSLNARMTVRDIIAEPLIVHNYGNRNEIDNQVRKIAKRCKLNVEHLRRFPHAFSGGQRQRISIARALVANPEFIVCDEPVSALDVSIQAEIINLLVGLQQERGFTYLFITHDLSLMTHISSRTAVMYLGRFVELAPTNVVFSNPRHPYTRALISAVPRVDPAKKFNPIKLKGEIPNPVNIPSGCRFHTRCPFVKGICQTVVPEWRQIENNHYIACHRADELVL